MTAADLVRDLAARGVLLQVADGQLRFCGPRSTLTTAVLTELRQRRAELVAALTPLPARLLVAIPGNIDPRRPSTWPGYLRDHVRRVRAEHGDAAALAEARAELEWLAGDARREGWMLLEPPIGSEPEPPGDLPEGLRRWPPGRATRSPSSSAGGCHGRRRSPGCGPVSPRRRLSGACMARACLGRRVGTTRPQRGQHEGSPRWRAPVAYESHGRKGECLTCPKHRNAIPGPLSAASASPVTVCPLRCTAAVASPAR